MLKKRDSFGTIAENTEADIENNKSKLVSSQKDAKGYPSIFPIEKGLFRRKLNVAVANNNSSAKDSSIHLEVSDSERNQESYEDIETGGENQRLLEKDLAREQSSLSAFSGISQFFGLKSRSKKSSFKNSAILLPHETVEEHKTRMIKEWKDSFKTKFSKQSGRAFSTFNQVTLISFYVCLSFHKL